MATITNTLIGKTTKSLDSVTFQRWKDKQVIRAKPIPSQVNISLLQKMHRHTMQEVAAALKNCKQIVEKGLFKYRKNWNPQASFINLNFNNLFATFIDEGSVNFNTAIWAKGGIENVYSNKLVIEPNAAYLYRFYNKYKRKVKPDEYVLKIFVVRVHDMTVLEENTLSLAQTGIGNIEIDSTNYPLPIYIIAFFYNIKKKTSSNSLTILNTF